MMGVDIYSRFVVGVRLEKYLSHDMDVDVKTKYDPDTGKPYEQKNVTPIVVIGNKRFTKKEYLNLREDYSESEDKDNLYTFTINGESDSEQVVLGFLLEKSASHRSRDGNMILEVDVDDLQALKVTVESMLEEQYGITDEATLFSIPYFSY